MYTSSYMPSLITSYFTGYKEPEGVASWKDSDIEVTLRRATEEEVPSRVYRVLCQAAESLQSLKNTWNLYRHRDFARLVRSSPSSDPFVNRVCNLLKTIIMTSRPPIMNEIFKHYRQDPEGVFFRPGQDPLVGLAKEILPDVQDPQRYFILTAGKEEIDDLREVVHPYLQRQAIQKRVEEIREIVQERIQNWEEKDRVIDLKQEVFLMAAEVFTKMFLGLDTSYQDVVKAVQQVFELSSKLSHRRPISSAEWEEVRALFAALFGQILANQDRVPLLIAMKEQNYDEGAMKCVLLGLLLGGHETTASMITYTLFRCAQDQHLQDDVFNNTISIDHLLAEGLRLSLPAVATTRITAANLVLEVRNRHTQEVAKRFIEIGRSLNTWMWGVAHDPHHFPNPEVFNPQRWEGKEFSPLTLSYKPFGGGKHACPGANLAWQEAQIVVEEVFKSYQLKTKLQGEPHFKQTLLRSIDQELPVTVQNR